MADEEAAERPVREQLKKASIDATKVEQPKDLSDPAHIASDDDTRGRIFKDVRSDDEHSSQHSKSPPNNALRKAAGRKRSRDSAIDESTPNDASKINKLETNTNNDNEPRTAEKGSATAVASDSLEPKTDPRDAKPLKSPSSPCTKRKRIGDKEANSSGDESTSRKVSNETDHGPNSPPLPNASTKTEAPLDAASAAPAETSKSAPAKPAGTSSSAFAASGFGALAGSTTSAFGALGGAKPLASFASPTPSTDDKDTKNNESAFSSGASKSGFASLAASSGGSAFGASGFGLGGSAAPASGFGSLGGSKLTSFANPSGGDLKTAKKPSAPAFGAPVKDADEEDDDDSANGNDESESDQHVDGDKKPDERFFERNLETGEEGEEIVFSCRAKLYNFVMSDEAGKKEWKERGLGILRLNMSADADDPKVKPRARLVMRADGSHRVILNTPIQKEIKFGSVKGDAPQNGFIYFMGSMDGGKLELLQLKMRQQIASEMYEHVVDVKRQM